MFFFFIIDKSESLFIYLHCCQQSLVAHTTEEAAGGLPYLIKSYRTIVTYMRLELAGHSLN